MPPATRRDRLPQAEAAARVQAGGRLVEEQHLRPGDERGAEVQAPAHAARVGADEPGARLVEREALEQVAGPGARLAARQPVQAAEQLEVLLAGQRLVDRGVLPGQADAAAQLGGLAHDVEAEHARAAAVGSQQRREDAHGGGLAGPVGAEHAEHAALLDAQADPVERAHLAVALLEALRLDRRGHAGPR